MIRVQKVNDQQIPTVPKSNTNAGKEKGKARCSHVELLSAQIIATKLKHIANRKKKG